MKTPIGLSRREFELKFGTNEQCINFLASQKWDSDFICRKCHCNSYRSGKKALFRRCLKCEFEGSPAAHTLFHKVKFDLFKAFGIIYDVLTSKKERIPFGYQIVMKYPKIQHGFLKGKYKATREALVSTCSMVLFMLMNLKLEPLNPVNRVVLQLKIRVV